MRGYLVVSPLILPRQATFFILIVIGRIVFFLGLLASTSFGSPALAENSARELLLTKALARAEESRLYDHPTWLALLHYKRALPTFASESLVDDAAFFLSSVGKSDRRAELYSTLKGIFEREQNREQAVSCAFPARYEWLKKSLEEPDLKFPVESCERFDSWFREINPGSASLVFPQAFLNNPASSFGHTLLRFDPPARPDGRTDELLSYAATFAAETSGENAVAYALKGLSGGYRGYFSVLPYYKKVNQYSAIENRDIWQYRLKFTEKEVSFIVKHLWELIGISFNYFYFDENCAYHLLSLFEVARPELNFTSQFFFWTVPVDTVRLVVAEEQLFESVGFRASPNTRLTNLMNQAGPELVKQALLLSRAEIALEGGELDQLSNSDQAKVIDLAYEYLNYKQYGKIAWSDEDKQRMFFLLQRRSNLNWSEGIDRQLGDPVRPDQGHQTQRLVFSAGYDTFGSNRSYTQMEFRPAHHELIDNTLGYVPGAQIEFLNTKFRQVHSDNLKLESIELLDIVSLSPRNQLMKPRSWKVRASLDREIVSSKERKLVSRLEAGAGRSASFISGIGYGFLGGSLASSEHFAKSMQIGGTAEIGWNGSLIGSDSSLLSAQAKHFEFGEKDTQFSLSVGQSFKLDTNLALVVEYQKGWESETEFFDVRSGVAWYY